MSGDARFGRVFFWGGVTSNSDACCNIIAFEMHVCICIEMAGGNYFLLSSTVIPPGVIITLGVKTRGQIKK